MLGKARSWRVPYLGYSGAESPCLIWCFTKKCCMRCDAWAGTMSWWSCQSPVDHSCGLLNHPNSFHGGLFKLNAKLDADLLLYLLSHFECVGHTEHMLTQWHLPPPLTSTVKSSLSSRRIPDHSLGLPGYINVTQTGLIILIINWIFSDRPKYHIWL